ncbi:tetratricopeptide repeat protein [Campylobacter fetus]|uniref:tetratricopeptide repeat protein n=1 Tax=Campylobacter fetus TaxID=196 RepID=UPI00138E1162|nr:tetratricopeptide repeat protein [Campylobacter fetus]
MGVEQNNIKAEKLYEKGLDALELDYKLFGHIGGIKGKGEHIANEDYAKAKAFYEVLCEKSMNKACYYIGYSYHRGENGFKQDYTQAKKYYEKVESCAGIDLYKETCNAGNMADCNRLGICIDTKNYALRMKYFKRSCDGGCGYGCINLAYYYKEGRVVRQNYKIAKEYYGRACDLGEELGCRKYAELNK